MKKALAMLLSCAMLFAAALALAEEPAVPAWAELLDEGDTYGTIDGLTVYREGSLLFDEYTYENPDEAIGNMTYFVYDPTAHGFEAGGKYPVVMWFHGGGNGTLGRDAITAGGAAGMALEANQQDIGGMYIICPLSGPEAMRTN